MSNDDGNPVSGWAQHALLLFLAYSAALIVVGFALGAST
jgi:hypothetical protein